MTAVSLNPTSVMQRKQPLRLGRGSGTVGPKRSFDSLLQTCHSSSPSHIAFSATHGTRLTSCSTFWPATTDTASLATVQEAPKESMALKIVRRQIDQATTSPRCFSEARSPRIGMRR